MTPKFRQTIASITSLVGVRLEELTHTKVCASTKMKMKTLSPRELAVLRGASIGHQVADTANELGIGIETVRSHKKQAQHKLGAKNVAHAVAEALRQKLFL